MNSQDIRNLQEAYFDVYQNLDERVLGQDPENRKEDSKERKSGSKRLSPSSGEKYAKIQSHLISYMDKLTKNNKIIPGMSSEEFDVILEYLLDEGYADTQESALAIMGNMSEDWRESIAENVTSGKSRVRNVQPKPTGPISNSERQSIIQSRIDAENIRIKKAGDEAHATATSKGLGFSDAQARRTAAELRLKREIAKSYR